RGEANHVLLAGHDLFLSLQCRSWQPTDEVRGIVRDPAGNPVAAALVEILARPDASEPALQSLWSDQQGRFCAVCPTANSRPVWVRATCLVGALQAATSGPHMPGTDDIDITLPH